VRTRLANTRLHCTVLLVFAAGLLAGCAPRPRDGVNTDLAEKVGLDWMATAKTIRIDGNRVILYQGRAEGFDLQRGADNPWLGRVRGAVLVRGKLMLNDPDKRFVVRELLWRDDENGAASVRDAFTESDGELLFKPNFDSEGRLGSIFIHNGASYAIWLRPQDPETRP